MKNPAGHNFRISREAVEDGWTLWGHCKCGHAVTARTYDDLHSLINDHYDDMQRAQQLEEEEAAR